MTDQSSPEGVNEDCDGSADDGVDVEDFLPEGVLLDAGGAQLQLELLLPAQLLRLHVALDAAHPAQQVVLRFAREVWRQ